MKVETQITTSIDLRGIEERLDGEALRVFEDHAGSMLKVIKNQWVGWKYEGRRREEIGESRRGWKHDIQATEGIRTMLFFNKAKTPKTPEGGGKSYSSYVKRRKGAVEEWQLVRDRLLVEEVPKMIRAVIDALRNDLSRGAVRQVRGNQASTNGGFDIDNF